MAKGHRKSRRGRKSSRVLPVMLGLAAFTAALAVIGAAALVKITESGLPAVPSWAEYAAGAPKVTRILAADNSVIEEVFVERRTLISPDSLPPLLENAVLAAEDAGFLDHEGLSYAGIARAMLTNLWKGRISQGGSTITQQVVKQVMLSSERTWKRKFRELLLARQFELKLSKNEILAIYMSQIYLGHGRYGFEEAARFFFAKRTVDLSLDEAALLAGLISAPEGNSPMKNPEGAIFRQHYVLDQMADLGMVTREQAQAAARNQLRIWGREEELLGIAPYFTDAVLRELKKLVGPEKLTRGGLQVATTLDLSVSAAVDAAVANGLHDLYVGGRLRSSDERSANIGQVDNGLEEAMPPPPETILARMAGCKRAEEQAFVSVGGSIKVISPESLRRLDADPVRRMDKLCDTIDSLSVSKGTGEVETVQGRMDEVNAELGPQAAFVVINHKTRAVLAMTGGENFRTRKFNRAVQSIRPIGSTIKPFIYTAALMAGIPEDKGWINEPVAFRGAGGKTWRPKNYGGVYDGRSWDMAGALKQSINVIAIKVLQETGVEKVAGLLESFGFKGRIPRDLSMALGSVEATPLELVNAFAVFGSGGKLDTPWMIRSVTDYNDEQLLDHERRSSRVIPANTASKMKSMLRGVVQEGTASGLADIGAEIWGKTGTTNMSREAWFVGGFGDMTGAVIIGYDDRLSMKGATGGNTAVPLFALFARNLIASGEPKQRGRANESGTR